MESNARLAYESILNSRIQGEKIIAFGRFILLIPLSGFAFFIFIEKIAVSGIVKAISEVPLIVNFVSIILVIVYSIWLLRKLKNKKYHPSIQFISPAIDITFLNFIIFFNAFSAQNPREGLIITGAPTFLYFVFLILAVLRYSLASVVFTGVYVTFSYAVFSLNSFSALSIFQENGSIFSNVLHKFIQVDFDDEVIKFIIFLMTTGLCGYIAIRIRNTIMNQITSNVEREKMRDTFITHVKDVSEELIFSGNELSRVYSEFLGRIDGIVKSSKNIEQETNVENNVVESTSKTISDIIRSIENVSGNIRNQSRLIEGTVASIEEMSGSIKMIADTSHKASSVAAELLGAARDGDVTVSDVNQAIIETETESKKIEEIVEIISGIAGTTNLLSMNAAIEAAHAGDAGKGFAVIAQEIGKLAETSGLNANQIAQILKDISARILNIVELANNANGKLRTIVRNSSETTEVNTTIRSAMEEELITINDMTKSLHDITALTEEVKSASGLQSECGDALVLSIEKLKKQADNVLSLAKEQMKDFNEINALSQVLFTAVNGNEKIVTRLGDLLKKI
jgi:methyl-accepting chemotaxis protein